MSKSRKWYRRKRVWLLAGVLFLFTFARSEFAKMRYEQTSLLQSLKHKTQLPAHFAKRSVGQKNIQYLNIGQRLHLPLLIFVHGSPGALNAYEDYFSDSTLLQMADIISVDRLGFGYSDFGVAEASLKIQAELIARIASEFPNRKKILVGHSLGGPVIAKFAMDYPQLTDALLMVAPSISPALEPSNRWRKFINSPLIRWFTPAALRVCNQEIIPLKAELEALMPHWSGIQVPTTVVQGEADELVPMENALFAERMMGETQVKINMIPGGNHFILWNEVKLIKDEIIALMEKVAEK